MVPPASHRVTRVRWYSGFTQDSSPLHLRGLYPLRRHFPEIFGYGSECFFLFLRVLRCFSSPGSLLHTYVFSMGYLSITSGAFPHSDIRGSTVVCTSPQLFAAYHVLHRLLLPRHSPCALLCLTFRLSFSSMTASLLLVRCSRTLVRSAPHSSRSLSCRKSPAR